MKAEDIPQEVMDIVDMMAGKKHSLDGVVAQSLAAALSAFDSVLVNTVREYLRAHDAVEEGLVSFDLHNDAVTRFEKADIALRKLVL